MHSEKADLRVSSFSKTRKEPERKEPERKWGVVVLVERDIVNDDRELIGE